MNNIELLRQRLCSGERVNVKLIGDSITQGIGGTGFNDNGEHILDSFYRNDNGYCWANLLRDYVEGHYNATVINNGCAGTTVQYTVYNIDSLVSCEDEFVICTIGTNNSEQRDENIWYIIHMDDINAIHKRVQDEVGITFISLYDIFCDYITQNDIDIRSLLVDGVHPNDKGYKIMYELLIKALGI